MIEVIAACRAVGFHNWAGAPDKYAYLRDRHRHEFAIECRMEVEDADREVECNDLKESVEGYLREQFGSPCEFGGMSCEHIAQDLVMAFGLSGCKVLEDGLNGAEVRNG